MSAPRPVSTAEVAAMLSVRESTVRRWCASGKIPAIKIGRRWFISRGEHDRILDALAKTAA